MAPDTTSVRPRRGTDLPVKGGLSVGKRGRSLEDLRQLPPLLTASQAFEVVGVSKSTGYEWIRLEVIPVVHLGARIYVRTAALLEEVLGIDSAALFSPDALVLEAGSTTGLIPDKKGTRS